MNPKAKYLMEKHLNISIIAKNKTRVLDHHSKGHCNASHGYFFKEYNVNDVPFPSSTVQACWLFLFVIALDILVNTVRREEEMRCKIQKV